MADPQHEEELDAMDRLTVRLYRAGFLISALALIGAGLMQVFSAQQPGLLPAGAVSGGWVAIAGGVALSVGNMHLYSKQIRWIIAQSSWVGLLLMLAAALLGLGKVGFFAGLGFVFVCISALALKERLCFRIPGLRLVPALLALSLLPLLLRHGSSAGVLLGLAGVIQLVLFVAKVRMPLHFDIGDKSAYQV